MVVEASAGAKTSVLNFCKARNRRAIIYSHHILHELLIVLGALLKLHQLVEATTVSVYTGTQLARAFSDPSVTDAVLQNDIFWKESDWEGIATPNVLTRNLHIRGRNDSVQPDGTPSTTLDFGFISRKVQLADFVTLEINRLITINYRIGNHNQAPGMDLLLPSAAGAVSILLISDSIIVHRACYPVTLQEQSISSFPRPIKLSGTQQGAASVAPPANCAAAVGGGGGSGAASRAPGCYEHYGAYIDFAVPGAEVDKYGKVTPSGIVVHMIRSLYACALVMTTKCIDEKGITGCAFFTFSQLQPPAPGTISGSTLGPVSESVSGSSQAAPAADNSAQQVADSRQPETVRMAGRGSAGGGSAGGADSDGSSSKLGLALGMSLGGVALLLALALAAILVRRRRRQLGAELSAPGEFCGSSAPRPSPSGVAGSASLLRCIEPEGGRSGGELPRHPCTDGCIPKEKDADADRPYGGTAPSAKPAPFDPSHSSSECVGAASLPSARLGAGAAGEAADRSGGAEEHVLGPTIAGVAGEEAADAAQPPLGEEGAGLEAEAVQMYGRALLFDVGAQAQADALDLFDPMVVVTPFTPPRRDLNLKLQVPTTAADASSGGFADGDAGLPLGADASSTAAVGDGGGDCDVALLPNAKRGRGSYGKVVEGLYRGQRVAVKLMADLNGQAVRDEGLLRSFVQEVEVLGRCQHPNVVRLLAACLTPPRICLVMELMDTSLDSMIRRAPGYLLPMDTAMSICLDIARGLEYLHPTIIHRDLKPANVLVKDPYGPRQVAKLTDFGLARLRSSVLLTKHPEAGTPPYMAPECFDALSGSFSHQMDMYSFGVVLWVMLSGKAPWTGLNMVRMAYLVTYAGQRLPLAAIPAGRRPTKLLRLIESCWEADPRRRPAAAEAVKVVLLVKEMMARGLSQEPQEPLEPRGTSDPRQQQQQQQQQDSILVGGGSQGGSPRVLVEMASDSGQPGASKFVSGSENFSLSDLRLPPEAFRNAYER